MDKLKQLLNSQNYSEALEYLKTQNLAQPLEDYNLAYVNYQQGNLLNSLYHLEQAKFSGLFSPELQSAMVTVKKDLGIFLIEKDFSVWDQFMLTITSVPTDLYYVAVGFLLFISLLCYLTKHSKFMFLSLIFTLSLGYVTFKVNGYQNYLNMKEFTLYAGPSKIFEEKQIIPPGLKVLLTKQYKNWSYIAYPSSYSGWVYNYKAEKNMNEEKIIEEARRDRKKFARDRIDIPMLKYFYQVSPLSGSKADNIPKFLRALRVLENFTDYELKVFSHFIHERKYSNDEVIFNEGESGFGFYLIYAGNVEIYTQKSRVKAGVSESYQQFIISLGRSEYFGELSLLENQNRRNATAVSKGNSVLLTIYKPDLEEMIDRHPVIGAKFLQAISLIVAMRFMSATEELKNLKEKCFQLEDKIESLTHESVD